MKCEEFILSVEEYLDGELDQVAASRVVAHMAACEPCAEYYETLEAEQALYTSYNRDVDVTPALWNAVHAQIQQDRARTRPLLERLSSGLAGMVGLAGMTAPRLALASALALAVVATSVSIAVLRNTPPDGSSEVATSPIPQLPSTPPSNTEKGSNDGAAPGNPPGVKPAGGPPENAEVPTHPTPTHVVSERRLQPKRAAQPEAAPAEPSPIARAENTYEAAIDVLERDYERRRTELDPQSVQDFEKMITVLDQTIGTTRKAARENPRDAEAVQHMLTAYSAKVDAMRNLVD